MDNAEEPPGAKTYSQTIGGVLRICSRFPKCQFGNKVAQFRAVAESAQNLASFGRIGGAYAPS